MHPPPTFLQSWAIFTLLLVTVLGGLFVAWINPATGFGDEYTQVGRSVGQSVSQSVGWSGTIYSTYEGNPVGQSVGRASLSVYMQAPTDPLPAPPKRTRVRLTDNNNHPNIHIYI